MLRRSSRLQASTSTSQAMDVEFFSDSSDDDVPESPRKPSKRRKLEVKEENREEEGLDEDQQKSSKKVGKRTTLQSIFEMPLDILFEIFGLVEPLDLLHLSRTSKSLRAMLMNKKSATVWQTSRRNVGTLPEIIPSLSEPAFANLLFDSHCHVCHTGISHIIIWTSAMRCCRDCLLDSFKPLSQILDIPNFCLPKKFLNLAPLYRPPKTRFRPREWKHVDCVYLVSGVEKLCREFAILNDSDAFEMWFGHRADVRLRDFEAIGECMDWDERRGIGRENELGAARKARQEAVIERLKALGWESELTEKVLTKLRNHKLVNQPKELTERIWKNIEPKLQEFMQTEKNTRLETERVVIQKKRMHIVTQLLNSFESKQPRDSIVPTPGDVALSPAFKAIIEGRPLEDGASSKHFATAMKQLPRFIEEWRASKTQYLLDQLRTHDPNATHDDLHLATTVFKCNRAGCGRSSLPFKRALAHRCDRGSFYLSSNLSSQLPKWCDRLPWNFGGNSIVFSEGMSRVAKEIVEGSGLDPKAVTTEEMVAMNPVIECTNCKDDSYGGRMFMRWGYALSHRDYNQGHAFQIITDTFDIAQVEEAELKASVEHPYVPWLTEAHQCAHCNYNGDSGTVRKHLKQEHGIVEFKPEHWRYNLRAQITSLFPAPVRMH